MIQANDFFWSLGIMAGKSNNWSLAERFILKALTINFDDFEKKPIQRHEVIRDQLRQRTLEIYFFTYPIN